MRLQRYLLFRCLGPFALTLALLCVTIWGLQALRLLQHFIGGGLFFLALMTILSLPMLLVFTIPAALALAMALVLARDHHEIEAMKTLGASPFALSRHLLLLIALCAMAVATLQGMVAPRAAAALERVAYDAASSSLIARARSGRFHTMGDRFTIYFESRRQLPDTSQELRHVFIALRPVESKPEVQLIARSATLRLQGSTLQMKLEEGELHQALKKGGLRRVTFQSLRQDVNLRAALAPHLSFLSAEGRRSGQLLGAVFAVCALGLLALACGLKTTRARRGLAWTLTLMVAHEVVRVVAGPLGPVVSLGTMVAALVYLRRHHSLP